MGRSERAAALPPAIWNSLTRSNREWSRMDGLCDKTDSLSKLGSGLLAVGLRQARGSAALYLPPL